MFAWFYCKHWILRNDEGHTKNDDHFSHVLSGHVIGLVRCSYDILMTMFKLLAFGVCNCNGDLIVWTCTPRSFTEPTRSQKETCHPKSNSLPILQQLYIPWKLMVARGIGFLWDGKISDAMSFWHQGGYLPNPRYLRWSEWFGYPCRNVQFWFQGRYLARSGTRQFNGYTWAAASLEIWKRTT